MDKITNKETASNNNVTINTINDSKESKFEFRVYKSIPSYHLKDGWYTDIKPQDSTQIVDVSITYSSVDSTGSHLKTDSSMILKNNVITIIRY